MRAAGYLVRVPAVFLPAAFLSVALAQPAQPGGATERGGLAGREPGAPRVQTAPVGAGTTQGSTTGTSHMNTGNADPGLPPPPRPELCDRYKEEVREQCLQTVLRGRSIERKR